MKEFSQKGWKGGCLDKLLKKIQQAGGAERKIEVADSLGYITHRRKHWCGVWRVMRWM